MLGVAISATSPRASAAGLKLEHHPFGECATRVGRDLIAVAAMWLRGAGWLPGRSLDHSAAVFPDRLLSATRPLRLRVASELRAFRVADQRPAWSCATQNPFSERRQVSWRQGKSEELPWVLRSRMALSAASIADARRELFILESVADLQRGPTYFDDET